jgi:hypothetical protein
MQAALMKQQRTRKRINAGAALWASWLRPCACSLLLLRRPKRCVLFMFKQLLFLQPTCQ